MPLQTDLKTIHPGEEKPNGSGFLYVLRFGEVYKIGQTGNINKRLSQIQNSNPFVDVIKKVEMTGYIEAEAYLHHLYRDRKIHGEWFILTEHDLDSILMRLRKEKRFHIISVQEFRGRKYTHSEEERIKILTGNNRTLSMQNKMLKKLLKAYGREIEAEGGEWGASIIGSGLTAKRLREALCLRCGKELD